LNRGVLLALAGAGLFVAALDAYVVVTLLPAMMGDVGLTIERLEQATPIITGFLAGYVVAMPLLGAYSDARGRIPVYLACLAAFAAGSVITATSGLWTFSGLPLMVAGRFIQGLGGGGLVPLSLALAADLYRDRSRTLALGSVAALQEAGSVVGPLYGATVAAAAASLGGWRFVFWLNLPLVFLCGAGITIAARLTPSPPSPERSSVDWPSAVLLGAGCALLVLAFYPDDPERRATNALTIPAAVAAAVVLAGYAWRHVRQLEPLIPRDLLRSRTFAGVVSANLLIGAALIVTLVDVPLLGRLVFNQTQLDSGLLLTQFLIGVPVGAVVGGVIAGRAGNLATAAIGLALSAIAFALMAGWQSNELTLRAGPLRQADLTLAVCGLGFGLVIAPLTAAALSLTRGQSHGLATSLVVLARTMGMLVGLAALTAFGLYRFHQILGTPVLTDTDLRSRVKHLERLVAAAFLQEYREIFLIAVGLCVLAAIVIAFSLAPGRRSGGT
jgi:MFS transporter, DHA2 family, triacylglyceride efflux pump